MRKKREEEGSYLEACNTSHTERRKIEKNGREKRG